MKKIVSIFLAIYLGVFGVFAMPETLIPIGQTAGITMLCDGVIITDLAEVSTKSGLVNPAKDAGLMPGDIIIEIDGDRVYSHDDLLSHIKDAEKIFVVFIREGNVQNTIIKTALDTETGVNKIGIWVKDSLAGIGTITYIDPQTNQYAALGHSICDSESGGIMPVREGKLIESSVADVVKGQVGLPGQLSGEFNVGNNLGTIDYNSETGIYGVLNDDSPLLDYKAYDLATFDEITKGKAYILTNVNGKEISQYEIAILDISKGEDKNFIIEVTDSELLAITGGVVQGMSGSPIIQNGKLVGAVTHVFVNDPTCGFGIFIDNMINTAESIGK